MKDVAAPARQRTVVEAVVGREVLHLASDTRPASRG